MTDTIFTLISVILGIVSSGLAAWVYFVERKIQRKTKNNLRNRKQPIRVKVRQEDGSTVAINYTPGDIKSADDLLTALKK